MAVWGFAGADTTGGSVDRESVQKPRRSIGEIDAKWDDPTLCGRTDPPISRLTMEAATYILFVLGCLGAADIALFHSVAHGIRSHPDSAKELVTHSLRGPTYAALFVFIPNFLMQGTYGWLLIGLFVFDVAISIWDFSLEQSSRRFLGGLPRGEYVLHIVIAMLFGALVASLVPSLSDWLRAPTRLAYEPGNVPWQLRGVMLVMAILVFYSGCQDGLAALRLRKQPKRSEEPAKYPCRH